MRKLLGFILFSVLVSVTAYGQTVQWASKVIGFSSELTPTQYSAQQALGKPNVLPSSGQNPNAWTPERPKRNEWIKLGFATPMQIQQIAIAESYNPGALFKVYIYDEAGKETLAFTFNPMPVPRKQQMQYVALPLTSYKVAAVKLEFDGKALTDYFSIDAVAITESNIPIQANLDFPALLAKGILVEQLDKNVNSDVSELNPVLSPDGKTLYFSRKNHPDNVGGVKDTEDIWFSELGDDGKWKLAKNMGPQFNNKYPNFVNSVSSATPDGQAVVMLLGNRYSDKGKMQAGVSISTKVGNSWTKPKAIIIEDEYNYNEKANYFLANTRKVLLMSTEREDSKGERDLYVSFVKKDSTWTKPLNLGVVVNTLGDETGPFLASDDKSLYFSSTGFSGFGGADIYLTKRLDDTWTKWSSPQNLGPDINSALDDLFFNIPSTSEYAYYSRGVSEDNTDIFRVKLPVLIVPEPVIIVKGKLLDSKTQSPVSAKIVYEDLATGKEVGVTQSDGKTGNYEIHLPGGKNYGVHAEAEGFLAASQSLDLRELKVDKTLANTDVLLQRKPDADGVANLNPITLTPVAPDATITLNNLFFEYKKSSLSPESFPELNRIVDLMKGKPTMTVEIAGHTDSIGGDAYNMVLSEQRAKSVTNYLSGKGIQNQRITMKFFGLRKPVDTNDTPEGRQKNRRVELKIIKM
jgi:outer membrane protein OmpA-like peptidoglycan-associated protein